MALDVLVAELDSYFRVADVRNDDWSDTFELVYPEPYWRQFVEPGYEGLWNGLVVRGADEINRVVTCVFPSDEIIAGLEPGTFLFSEHPIAFEDDLAGFEPLARASFERMKRDGISFYHVHAPLDQHSELSPSRLVAEGLALRNLEEYFPIADGIPGGAVVAGEADATVAELATSLRRFLGDEVPIRLVTHRRKPAGRVAIAAGGGAELAILEASLERGCTTFVSGNIATRCRLDFVQEGVRAFRERAEWENVALVDATHYGLEKPPQLAMLEWFRERSLEAEFRPGRPES
ncbi:MAG: Nif3-like dinuclear metal center hexameric protein [Actinomycetota bacterium]|nr:Nif3-like dinuclear metal center hexameric protein [Actinomycetota bacterium]